MGSTPLEIVEQGLGRAFETEDGEVGRLELQPPASPEEIEALEAGLPGALPPEIRALLERTRGFSVLFEEVELMGATGQYLDGASPHQHDVMGDGFGNSWFVDVRSDGTWGGVYFACHDPPVMLHQSDDLAAFFEDLLRAMESPDSGELISSMDPKDVWGENPLARPRAEALDSGDDRLREFAQGLPADALVVDLRAADPGDGFAWGCFGPETEIRRAGDDLIFALVPPEGHGQRRRGLLSRLFGR